MTITNSVCVRTWLDDNQICTTHLVFCKSVGVLLTSAADWVQVIFSNPILEAVIWFDNPGHLLDTNAKYQQGFWDCGQNFEGAQNVHKALSCLNYLFRKVLGLSLPRVYGNKITYFLF